MEPVAYLDPQPWMTAPPTRRVVDALTAEGAEVRFVGGCVRDAVAGRTVRDIDIATPDPPARVMELLERAGLRVVPTGLEHGTVTAVADGRPFEITTLRHDIETFGRRARVAFTDDWVADAARRDFTINALSCTPEGALYDPFGGLADLRAGIVRFVGEPRERIREDVLRLLRFFRFFAHYGRPPPHAESLAACIEMAPQLGTLSAERVRAELLRLLEAPAPGPVLRLMSETGILDEWLPEARRFDRLDRLVSLETRCASPAAVRRLAAVLETDREGALAIARRLRLSKSERDRIVSLSDTRPELGVTPPEIRRALYRVGPARYVDHALLAAAEDGDEVVLERRLRLAAAWRPRRLPVGGSDAMALGARGPAVGRLLAAVEDWWVSGDFRADRTACLQEMERIAGERSLRC